MAQHHRVEPADATTTPGVGAVLAAAFDDGVADGVAVEQLGRERPAPTRLVYALTIPDHPVDRARTDAGTGTHRAGDRVRRRDEGIRAVVEVEVRGLRAFEEHRAARRRARRAARWTVSSIIGSSRGAIAR